MKKGYKVFNAKKIYFDNLLGGHYLFEILHTSAIMKTIVKMWQKVDVSRNSCNREQSFFVK